MLSDVDTLYHIQVNGSPCMFFKSNNNCISLAMSMFQVTIDIMESY